MTPPAIHGIEDDDVDRLIMYFDRAEKHLGLEAYYTEAPGEEDIHEHAYEMLAGKRPVPRVDRVKLDTVSRALLKYHGADPDAVEALVSAAHGLGLKDVHNDSERWALFGVHLDDLGECTGIQESRVDTGPLTWVATEQAYALHVPGLPDTIRTAVIGRRLNEIVSHPVLDLFRLVIDSSSSKAFTITFDSG